MKNIKRLLNLGLVVAVSACCEGEDPMMQDLLQCCEYQRFKESGVASLDFKYTVNTTGNFVEAHVLRAKDIQDALKVDGNDFTVEEIKIVSSKINYTRASSNTSGALSVNIGVVGNTFNQMLLLKQNVLLPLYDVPFLVNINKDLNGSAITDLSKILETHAVLLNDQGISFLLTGSGTPGGTRAHFDLTVRMNLAIVYEVCRFVPLGLGMSVCE